MAPAPLFLLRLELLVRRALYPQWSFSHLPWNLEEVINWEVDGRSFYSILEYKLCIRVFVQPLNQYSLSVCQMPLCVQSVALVQSLSSVQLFATSWTVATRLLCLLNLYDVDNMLFASFPHFLSIYVLNYCSTLTLGDPMDCSMPGFLVLHYLLEFAQIHVHWVSDAIYLILCCPFPFYLQYFSAEVDAFLELPCFLSDPANVGSLISGFSASLKPSLYIWKSLNHILLKISWKDFEHELGSMWNEHNCTVVWTFFGTALLWHWNENWPFPVLWPLLRFPNLLMYWVQHFNSIIF